MQRQICTRQIEVEHIWEWTENPWKLARVHCGVIWDFCIYMGYLTLEG